MISEPLSRLGASVTAIDAAAANVEAARLHSQASSDPRIRAINYINTTAEQLLEDIVGTETAEGSVGGGGEDAEATTASGKGAGKLFDLVVTSEVVEHVNNPEQFVKTCASLVAPGGVLIVTTINRTPLAYLMGTC